MAYTKVVIVGGGFGGLNAAKILGKADADILIIDKTNHHVFQPLLYQVATAALAPGNIAIPIREVVRNQENTSVIMADVIEINKQEKYVKTHNGDIYRFDYLILAPGARHSYFGKPEWEAYAPGLKTIADAIRIRERILLAFERAERSDSYTEAENYLRFVIVGGGPTGVEMAGDIAAIAHKTLFKNFRKIKPEQSEIYLIESGNRILATYPEELSEKAQKDLEKMGVKVLTGKAVTRVSEKGVWIGDQFMATHNVIWAAGNQASPLLKQLDVPLDRQGRVIVGSDLSIPNNPYIFVIGDAAHFPGENGQPLPGIAPVAVQEGKYVANVILNKASPESRPPFEYFDKGTMATIGKAKAVAVVGGLKFSGFLAWLAWGFVHILYLISFRNRFLVASQWSFWYLTNKRQQRLIARPIYDFHDEGILDNSPIMPDEPRYPKKDE